MGLLRNVGVGRTKLINEWLAEYTSIDQKSWKIEETWTIVTNGTIRVKSEIPQFTIDADYIKKTIIRGSFDCSDCENLTSLKGVPEEIDGSFYCEMCTQLSSLEGAPQKVHGNFNCSGCENLESLEGAPKEVDGHFVCYGTRFSEEDVRNVAKIKVKGNVYCSK